MATVEKISVALPPQMVAAIRQLVDLGEYASSSEVIREALRDWTDKRNQRAEGMTQLREMWQQALNDRAPGAAPDEVLDRLERKYQALADSTKQ